jgi:hypothetical protein
LDFKSPFTVNGAVESGNLGFFVYPQAAGVMATSPATTPEARPSTVGFLSTRHSANIQAVSPEFKPSEASAEEKGIASKITAVSRLFDFIFKTGPP